MCFSMFCIIVENNCSNIKQNSSAKFLYILAKIQKPNVVYNLQRYIVFIRLVFLQDRTDWFELNLYLKLIS